MGGSYGLREEMMDQLWGLSYLDASGYPRIEQGYYKRVKGQLVLVKQGGYTVLYPDNRLHWISYIADEYGFRTKDYIF
ncbi:unnamed protein product [Bemisia tabaci]|uniref:Uncharacterized protein n=1 Tax=Bemisia tabaci TaxID=7038 RepID=A0A9P0FAG9_BEMTA|nr:unnamed protein product [Bemisia tabaci]